MYLNLVDHSQGFPPVLELPLPIVNCTQVGVQHDGQTCYSGMDARQVPAQEWRALDAALQPTVQGEAHTNGLRLEGEAGWGLGVGWGHGRRAEGSEAAQWWAAGIIACQSEAHVLHVLATDPACCLSADCAGGSRARLNEAEEGVPPCCCVGEAVGVDVELSNPLQMDLGLTRLRLACSWEPAAGAAEGSGGAVGSQAGSTAGAASEGFQVGSRVASRERPSYLSSTVQPF